MALNNSQSTLLNQTLLINKSKQNRHNQMYDLNLCLKTSLRNDDKPLVILWQLTWKSGFCQVLFEFNYKVIDLLWKQTSTRLLF